MKRLVALLIITFTLTSVFSQDYSNKGKEFWIAYSSHIDEKESVMGIYITSDQNAIGNISVNGTNIPFNVIAKQVTRKFLGQGQGFDGSNDYVYLDMQDATKINGAIKVTSDVPVVVYAHIIKSARSAATLVLPTPVLGTEYIVPSYYSKPGNSSIEEPGIGIISVVATQPNTVIEINPTIAGRAGRAAGVPFQVTLANPGDCYQFHGTQYDDISGSTVKSIATSTTGCKPIAVFGATTWSAFNCASPIATSGDNLYQQLFPVRSWGKQFITAPFINRPYDIYRVFVKDTGTVVTLIESGITTVLGTAQYNTIGRFYEFQTGNPVYVSANKAISLVQYITSTVCKNGCSNNSTNQTCYADPEMVLLNPIEQTLKDITFFSADASAVTVTPSNIVLDFVNIIINKNFKNTVKIDGAAPNNSFIDIPGTNYCYLQEDVTPTATKKNSVHNVVADTGFSAIVYGYGRVESYGYNGGTNVTDLYQYITLANQYGSVNFPAVCKGLPFYFSITLPYQPIQLNWDFNGDTNLSPHATVVNNSPVYDSTFIKDGRSLYVYKLPNAYTFTQIGTYNVKVITNNPTTDGCNGLQEIDYQVQVFENPVANFGIITNGCTNMPITFVDSSQTSGRSIIKWLWNFGDGTKDSIANPSKLYTSGGTYPIKYTIITDVGCFADTVKNITLAVPPVAKFGVQNILCTNKAISFTDSSTVDAPSVIAKWYWDFGNGTKDTATNNNPISITYTDTGTYTVTLLVESNSSCRSLIYSKTIYVNAMPKLGFVLPQVCLDDAFAQFIDTSTISDNSTFTWAWNFGDPNATLPLNGNTSIFQNPKHKYADTGIYNVQLIITSSNFCKDSLTKSFTVNGSTPIANFVVLNSNALCSNDSVRIKNTSTVDFGNITKLEIYWDTVNNPTFKTTDNFPKPNKIYATLYNSFQQPATQTIYVKMLSYSGITCVNEKVVAITLHQSPKIQFLAIPSICNDTTPRNITQASEVGGVAGTGVYSGLGIINAATGLFSPQLVAAGADTLKYTYTSTTFGCVDTALQTIKVLQSPTAKFAVASPTCVNNNITFLDSSIANVGAIVKWDWAFGNNTFTTKTDSLPFAIQYNSVKTYFATLKVTTDSGCHNSVTIAVNVHPLPTVYFGLPTICLPDGRGTFLDSTTISDGSNQFTYHWNFGDATDTTSSSLKNPVHKFSDTASKQIVLIVTSGAGCKDSLQKPLTIYPQPKARFTVEPDTSICYGAILNFYDKSNGISSPAKQWNWDLGFGYTSTQQNPVQTYLDTGTVAVTLYIHNLQNCVDTFKQTIIVNPYPIIQLPATLNFLQGGLLTIKPIYYYGHNLSYEWTPNKFIVNDTVLFAQVYPDDDQRYLITVKTNGKCPDTASVQVVVLKTPIIPNVFSPNGDGINDTWVIEHLESYPGCTVTVFDRGGQQVFAAPFGYTTPWNGTSNGKDLPIGTYYYIIDPKNGRGLMSGSVTILR